MNDAPNLCKFVSGRPSRACRSIGERCEKEELLTKDQIDVIATTVSTLTLLLVAYQVRQVNVWNRRQSSFNFIDTDRGRLLERDLDDALRQLGIDLMVRRNSPLTVDEIGLIRKSGRAATAVNHFTNDLQNLCAALRYKLVDDEVFRAIHAGRIKWWYRLLAPYVVAMRSELDDPRLWEDFQRVAAMFRSKPWTT